MYTHGHHESVLRSHRWRTAQNSAGYLLPYLRPGASLLDVGCGPGTITADLAARLAPGRVTGIDLVGPVIEQAEAEYAHVFGALGFEAGDILSWRPGERFDVVHAHQVLQHAGDPVAVLRAMAAHCVSGGLVAARDASYPAMSWYPRLPELDRWLELYVQVARANGGEPDAGPRLLAWARAAGLDVVTASASVWCFATDGDRAWWGQLWAARVTESDLARHAVDQGLATSAGLSELAAGWRRWAADPDGWFAVPHGEIVARRPTP
jgi:SAM-dependent methyltransferase